MEPLLVSLVVTNGVLILCIVVTGVWMLDRMKEISDKNDLTAGLEESQRAIAAALTSLAAKVRGE